MSETIETILQKLFQTFNTNIEYYDEYNQIKYLSGKISNTTDYNIIVQLQQFISEYAYREKKMNILYMRGCDYGINTIFNETAVSDDIGTNNYLMYVYVNYKTVHNIELNEINKNKHTYIIPNIHLLKIGSTADGVIKNIYLYGKLLFTLERKRILKGGISIEVIEIKDNTVPCIYDKYTYSKIERRIIENKGMQPNAKIVHIDETTNKSYILENGFFKIYYRYCIIEQLIVLPDDVKIENIHSIQNHISKQEFLKQHKFDCTKKKSN